MKSPNNGSRSFLFHGRKKMVAWKFLTNSQALCPNFRDAEKFGLERAKDWIDRKVSGLH
jgi:hypothetical protein